VFARFSCLASTPVVVLLPFILPYKRAENGIASSSAIFFLRFSSRSVFYNNNEKSMMVVYFLESLDNDTGNK